jgi:hypothetical protein
MYAVRALLLLQIKREFAAGLDRQYHHEKIAAEVYRKLAARPQCGEHRDPFLRRATLADRKAHHCAVQLSLLGPAKSPRWERRVDGAWRWVLLHCGLNMAIRCLGWMERRDSRELDALYDARDFYRGRTRNTGY